MENTTPPHRWYFCWLWGLLLTLLKSFFWISKCQTGADACPNSRYPTPMLEVKANVAKQVAHRSFHYLWLDDYYFMTVLYLEKLWKWEWNNKKDMVRFLGHKKRHQFYQHFHIGTEPRVSPGRGYGDLKSHYETLLILHVLLRFCPVFNLSFPKIHWSRKWFMLITLRVCWYGENNGQLEVK